MTWLKADVMVNAGYLVGSAIFLSVLIVLVIAQIVARRVSPVPLLGNHRCLHHLRHDDGRLRHPLAGNTAIPAARCSCSPASWSCWRFGYRSEGTISVNTVSTPRVEAFYWAAITFSQTLGTALGEWIADTGGLGYEGGALVFGAGLAVTAALYYWTEVSVAAVWAAFILTRPLGATFGRFPRQAVGPWWTCLEPSNRLCSNRIDHGRLCSRHSAKGGEPSKSREGIGLADRHSINALTCGRQA